MKKAILIASVLIGTLSVNAQNYSVDKAHSSVAFVITHMKLNEMPGNFGAYEIKFTSSKDDFSDATVEVTLDVNTINTGSEGRDKHLKSADFFNAEKNPNVTFKSKSFKKVKGNMYKITGDMTMNGITKEVVLDAQLKGKTINPYSKKDVYVWKVTGKVSRKLFEVGKDMPADMVDDLVNLNINLEMTKE